MHMHMQVNILRMSRQFQYFDEYQGKLRALVGAARARQLVRRSLVLITLGGNDFVNNYYLVPMSVRSRQYALQDYVPFIISEYRKILSVRCFYSYRALSDNHQLLPIREPPLPCTAAAHSTQSVAHLNACPPPTSTCMVVVGFAPGTPQRHACVCVCVSVT